MVTGEEADRNLYSLFETYCTQPWLMWLSGLSASLGTQGSPVQFPGRTQAWVVGMEACEWKPHIDVSVPLSLSLSPFSSL